MAVKVVLATLTSKGRITVPVEVQRRLGLKPHDTVAFAIDTDTDEVILRPAAFPLAAVFGSIQSLTDTDDFKAISREAQDQKAAEEVRKLEL